MSVSSPMTYFCLTMCSSVGLAPIRYSVGLPPLPVGVCSEMASPSSGGQEGQCRHPCGRPPHTHTHCVWPLQPRPCFLEPQQPFLCSGPLRRGGVLSGSLKPCLYCQRSCQHLPPLEHLVPSCWLWTENCTIGSPMNCYFWERDKHVALYRLSLNLKKLSWDFLSPVCSCWSSCRRITDE